MNLNHLGNLPTPLHQRQRGPALSPVRKHQACRSRVHDVQPSASSLWQSSVIGFLSAPGMCFDKACQDATDKAFLIALSIPLVVAAVAIAYILRPPPKELIDSGRVFQDPSTGVLFEGAEPERDKKGEIVFRPIGYTPWPVEEGYEGVRVRVPVGPVRKREPRTFVFAVSSRSELVQVTLPRPLGLVFEYQEGRKRAVVSDLVEGSYAEQKAKVAALNQRVDAALPGDVLRAVTATNFVYPTRALFGAVPPERHIVLYGADNQSWASVSGALRKGEAKDGEVTLILERRVSTASGTAAATSSSTEYRSS